LKKPQFITIAVAALLVAGIYLGAKTTPKKKPVAENSNHSPAERQAHNETTFSIDTFLTLAKRQLTADQVLRISALENSISRGAVKDQQIDVYHKLARFYYDTANAFEPYAWYTAEAARLENSEKNLTFAARLFLDKVMSDVDQQRRFWMASQSKDLFERSLIINPANDSAKVGIGACNLFGNISANPMQDGMMKIREVADRDSLNIYAQEMMAQASLMSGQYDKAVNRLEIVARHKQGDANVLLMLADVNEQKGNKKEAIDWYQKSLLYLQNEDIKAEIRKRIEELKK
jgi:tetratricopeptide (TPR) repeat protein